MVKRRWSGELFAIVAAILWGLNYQVVKTILCSVPEGQFLVIRFVSTVIILALLLLAMGEGFAVGREDRLRIMALGLLGVGVYNIFWTYGVHRTTASNAALLISTSPIFAGIYGAIIGEERLGPQQWAGIIISFLGIFVINYWTPGSRFSFGSETFDGNLLVLLGAILFALYAIIAKPILQRYSPMKLTTLAMAWGLPILVPFGLLQPPAWNLAGITPAIWLDFGYVVLLGTVVAFACWYQGIRETTPVKTVIFLYLTPVVSMASGVIWFGEKVGMGQIAGAALVLLGLLAFKADQDAGEQSRIKRERKKHG
ncbi:MAG: EamA family transporter [Thermacetogeniaceae bacterium]